MLKTYITCSDMNLNSTDMGFQNSRFMRGYEIDPQSSRTYQLDVCTLVYCTISMKCFAIKALDLMSHVSK